MLKSSFAALIYAMKVLETKHESKENLMKKKHISSWQFLALPEKLPAKLCILFFLGERFHEFSISFLKFVLIVFVRSFQKVEWIAEKVKKSSFCNLV